ncbi:MAG TPA: hypothetical protein GXX75_14425 [Clostridiales bacterium]|nr:hypothetical protein [Clostridiales bacterium]
MDFIWVVPFIILLLMYEKIWRIKICKNKIDKHIRNENGYVVKIEKLSERDEIFSVYYSVNGQEKHSNVKFNFLFKDIWENH